MSEHASCPDCQHLREQWRQHGPLAPSLFDEWAERYGRDLVTEMDLAEHHVLHHAHSEEPHGLAAMRVLVELVHGHDPTAGMVPAEEMTRRVNAAYEHVEAERRHLQREATADAERRYGTRLRTAETRVANVAALLHQAGRRKTLRTEAVSAALGWRDGDELPEATRTDQAQLVQVAEMPPPCDVARYHAHLARPEVTGDD
jgi:hypothetical protein